MTNSDTPSSRDASPTLEQFAGLGYIFLLVSIIDVEPSNWLRGILTPLGGGRYPGAVILGILLVGAVAVIGLYFRKAWGLIASVALFGFYSSLMFYAGELTIGGVAGLYVFYLLSRADTVLETES